jgi:hypothetical protein
VQSRGGGGQYPTLGGGPHIIDGPSDAGPHGGGDVGDCPPPGDPPYGIIVDALDPCNSFTVRIYNLTTIKTR